MPECLVLTMVMFDRTTLRRTAQKCLLSVRMDAGRKLSETRCVVVMQAYVFLLFVGWCVGWLVGSIVRLFFNSHLHQLCMF